MASDDDSGARWRRYAVAVVLMLGMIIAACVYRPDKALRVAMGLAAHDLCSAVFITGRDPDAAYFEGIAPRPGFRLVSRFVHYEVNREKGLTQAWIGGVRRRAQFTPGRGCMVLLGGEPQLKPARSEPASLAILPDIAGPGVAAPSSPAIAAGLDRLFTDADPKSLRQVKAVVVLHRGKIIAERYAEGFGVDTPVNGWSASKSIMSALVGVLVREGKLRVDQPAPVPLWRVAGDPRGTITIDELLRMTSGLSVDEDNSGFDVSSQIQYNERDTYRASIVRPLKHRPGAAFHYGSPNTLILSGIARQLSGGTNEAFQRFARQELFEPLGMSGVTMETDGAGTALVSSYILAPPRSWARFGQLYLQDGKIGAVRILPPGWVDFSARATLGSDYGAGFWTNRSGAEDAQARIGAGMPADAFYASGAMGQRIYILPTQQVVIVRMGLTPDGDFGIRQDIAFIKTVLDAIGQGQAG